MVCPGKARPGLAGHGEVRQGKAWGSVRYKRGRAGSGEARRGLARPGLARRGKARFKIGPALRCRAFLFGSMGSL